MIPVEAPAMSPWVRPALFIYRDAGIVATAPPSTHVVTGSVPIAGLVASAMPARPLIEARVELLLKSMAWHAASKVTLRRVLSIFTVSSRQAFGEAAFYRPHPCQTTFAAKPGPSQCIQRTRRPRRSHAVRPMRRKDASKPRRARHSTTAGHLMTRRLQRAQPR